ncbi:MAG: AAA family ATPase [Actinomycetia bacterium]|nr:AAA family ATPase [Actinomycetes bacterium]MCH9801256.1 AAA family ATPase [Actinomycetes bacterium]
MTCIVEPDADRVAALVAAAGNDPQVLSSLAELRTAIENSNDETVVLGPGVDQQAALELVAELRVATPLVGFVLVRERVDTSILSEALRSGVREVVALRDLAEISAAVRRSQDITQLLHHSAGDVAPTGPRGKVITVFSPKGGTGKTTFAVNLAVDLVRSGAGSVVLLDLDLAFGDVAISLQLDPKRSVADAVKLNQDWDDAGVRALLTSHPSGLQVLTAPDDPSLAETVGDETVRGLLAALSRQFDYVIVDSPPALSDVVLAAFDHSDHVALLTSLDIPALKNTKITLRTVEALQYPRDRFGLVLNRADSKVGLDAADVQKVLQTPVVGWIPSSRDVPTLTNRGAAITAELPDHAVSRAIKETAAALIGGRVAPVAAQPRKRIFRKRRKVA